ncbi:MAG: WG repeat-containing protein [Chitinophagaceae bacterium]|nr:WG repeat-containing protein [Chitinophagaceae bacterium]
MKKLIIFIAFICFSIYAGAQIPEPFHDEKTNKYGYKDESGKVVIKPVYNIAYEFTDGKYAAVNIGADYKNNKGGKWGIIDTKGKLIHPVKYDNAHCLGYNLFALNIGHKFSNMDASPSGKITIFNAAGKALTPFIYSGFLIAIRFEEGYAPLETWDGKKQRYGLLDSTGKVAVPVKYDEAYGFREGLCKLVLNGKAGFIDKTTKMVIPMKYEDANVFSDGLASVKLGGKWGFVDSKGKEVIALQYEDAKHFEEGYAAAKQNGKWGVINKENKLIVGFIYDEIIWIKNDANEIRIKKGNKYINVDRQGNEIKN